MVSNKHTKKAKKPIETTLGKAPEKPKETEQDISHLRKPIETSISGISEVLAILKTATSEVKDYLLFECDIMYECRQCRTIFRSLANFILHKRNFCKEKFSSLKCTNNNNNFKMTLNPPNITNVETSALGKVIQKLHNIERVREFAKEVLTADLSSDLTDEPVKNMDICEKKASDFKEIILEKIDSNDSGIFQTLVIEAPVNSDENVESRESMKSEVLENHKKLENDVPVLDPEGKICGFTSSNPCVSYLFPKSKFKCIECNQQFATQKSLTNHVKCVHNPSRIVYICPTCKDTFANPWSVYRHLIKVHRMTNKQVRRMRDQIHNSRIRRSEESSSQRKKSDGANQIAETNRDNQWINDIEGDKDFQMCAGCGKHFERKAALQSHSQMCAKRLEVCNTIKENAKKKSEEEASEKAKFYKATNCKSQIRGASKRKGQNICGYRRKPTDENEQREEIMEDLISAEDFRASSSDLSDISQGKSKAEVTTSKVFDKHYIPSTEVNSRDLSVVTSSTNCQLFHKEISSQQISRSNSFVDSTEAVLSPSSCEIVSRTNSIAEIICLSSEDESEEFERIAEEKLVPSPDSEASYKLTSVESDGNLLQDSNLFSSKVSFEMFCKKVAKNENKTSRKRKRTLDVDKGADNIAKSHDEGDVIFMGETLSVENGFHGFSNEEKPGYSLLKCELKNTPRALEQFPKDVKNELNFLPKAAPYMNCEKLTCIPCGITFTSFDLLIWHMSAHFSWFRYQCSKCSYITFNKSDCISHAKRDHDLLENLESSYILPLPNWKTVLMSHEFRLLTYADDPKGKHTDEVIVVNEEQERCTTTASPKTIPDSETVLFGNYFSSDKHCEIVAKKDNAKKRAKFNKGIIDTPDSLNDYQKLPEPVELGMPADVSEVIKLLDTDGDVGTSKEAKEICDYADESNDDWGFPKLCTIQQPLETVDVAQDQGKEMQNEIVPLNVRPARVRNKVKQDDDFVYYDSDINNILKVNRSKK